MSVRPEPWPCTASLHFFPASWPSRQQTRHATFECIARRAAAGCKQITTPRLVPMAQIGHMHSLHVGLHALMLLGVIARMADPTCRAVPYSHCACSAQICIISATLEPQVHSLQGTNQPTGSQAPSTSRFNCNTTSHSYTRTAQLYKAIQTFHAANTTLSACYFAITATQLSQLLPPLH